MHRKSKKFAWGIAAVAVLLLVGYRFYVVYMYGIKTEVILNGSITGSVYADGIILRKETEVLNNKEGSINFLLNDGEKINKGGTIAQIYKSEASNLQQKELERLDKEISTLEALEKDKNKISTNLNYLEKRTHQILKKFFSCVNDNGFADLMKNKEDILYLLNERQAIVDKTYSFSERLEDLKKQREKIAIGPKEKVGTIVASESGYFVGNVDGFENACDYDAAESMNKSQLQELLKSKGEKTNAIAKIVNLPYWYMVCCIAKDQAKNLVIGNSVSLLLFSANIDKIPANVVAMNDDGTSADICIILKSNYLNRDILNIRKEKVKINFFEYSGLKVNKKAIHEKMMSKTVKNENGEEETVEKKVQGVYVVKNKQLIFKEIIITHIDEKFAICKEKPAADEIFSGKYIEQYDEIVVRGVDLYEGKKIKKYLYS
ncbi:MAG: hypothetical protein IJ758_03445 [Clostridia bacterium]|nr:hypothetical protein [Clostridia bacterium]